MLAAPTAPRRPTGLSTAALGVARPSQRLTTFAPSLADVEFAYGWAGLYEITPDCNAVIGEAQTDGFRFLYAAGSPGTAPSRDPRSARRPATSTT
jgi:glycine/D-amino acid oxidase-like deaminating enzyme